MSKRSKNPYNPGPAPRIGHNWNEQREFNYLVRLEKWKNWKGNEDKKGGE